MSCVGRLCKDYLYLYNLIPIFVQLINSSTQRQLSATNPNSTTHNGSQHRRGSGLPSPIKSSLARLKPQDQRSLVQSYIDMVTQTSLASSTDKLDLVKLKKTTKIDKPLQFFQDFCVALHRKCQNVKKGFNVGPIFVTQVQVNLILKHGIMAMTMTKKGNIGKSQKHLKCQSRIRTV